MKLAKMIDLQFHYQQKWLIILANNDWILWHDKSSKRKICCFTFLSYPGVSWLDILYYQMSSISRNLQIHIWRRENISSSCDVENLLIVPPPQGVAQLTRQAQIVALRDTNFSSAFSIAPFRTLEIRQELEQETLDV